jgi:hypothetical protein
MLIRSDRYPVRSPVVFSEPPRSMFDSRSVRHKGSEGVAMLGTLLQPC